MELLLGNCLDRLKDFEDNSVDAIVTDPPYGLSFMGKKWDYDVPSVDIWKECLRVLKPGGYLLSFAGTRTQHRMAVNIEDAGFEIRDMIAWVYGSGFPKSLNVGKSVNQLETNEWTKISKALDNIQKTDIIRVWKSNSNNVNIVAKLSQRQATVVGKHTDLNDSVLLRVVLPTSQEKQNTSADTVGIALNVHQATPTRINTVLQSVVAEIKQLQEPVKFMDYNGQSHSQSQHTTTSTAQESAKDTPSENMANKIRVEEALKTLRGKRKYSDEETISVLCAVLTENLLHTILNQSKTFQSLDTTSKTECASAITVTITEYMAECLTTYTVDIAKSKAVDKLQENEREVLPPKTFPDGSKDRKTANHKFYADVDSQENKFTNTKGTSKWEGWGTALKPALEPITVARKPIEGTVAQNCLKWGVGGINIDGCRVGTEEKLGRQASSTTMFGNGKMTKEDVIDNSNTAGGRFPANLIHDGSDEVVGLFPNSKARSPIRKGGNKNNMYGFEYKDTNSCDYADSGSAARFFYCAKASKRERNIGCEGLELTRHADRNIDNGVGGDNPRNRTNTPKQNFHPTVKPIALMEYLVKLVSREGQVVLDPFMGSGTTGMACKKLNRDFIGIEMMPEYMEIAKCRIEATKKEDQLNML